MRNWAVVAILLSINLQVSIAQGKDPDVPSSLQVPEHEGINARQVTESEIAGLHPGQDAMRKAYHRFGKDRVNKELSQPGSAVWLDVCNRQMLSVAFDTNDIIRDVRIQHTPGVTNADCDLRSYSRSVRSRMGGTGHGLIFGDRCDRVQEVYGSPHSGEHSARGGQESHSFVYHFDRGSKGTKLTLEITCDSTSRQVRTIALSASGPANP
jgi:hypothetical protein